MGFDSVDALQLVVALDKKYGLKIPDPESAREVLQSVKTMAEAGDQAPCLGPHESSRSFRVAGPGATAGRNAAVEERRSRARTRWHYVCYHGCRRDGEREKTRGFFSSVGTPART